MFWTRCRHRPSRPLWVALRHISLIRPKRQLRTPLVAPYEKPRFKPVDCFGWLSASKRSYPHSHQNCRRTCPEHKALVCNLMVPDVIETLTSHLRLSWDRSRRQPSKFTAVTAYKTLTSRCKSRLGHRRMDSCDCMSVCLCEIDYCVYCMSAFLCEFAGFVWPRSVCSPRQWALPLLVSVRFGSRGDQQRSQEATHFKSAILRASSRVKADTAAGKHAASSQTASD